jgi:hypothetical protein
MEYKVETRRLPRPHVSSKRVMQTELTDHATLNIFSTLTEYQIPDKPMGIVRQSERGEEDQGKFEFMCKRQKEASILHESHGHRNPTSLVKDLKAAGIPIKHLQRYLHAHRCKYCEANLGRASYYCKSDKQTRGDEVIFSTIVDPLSPHMHLTQTLANKHEVTSALPQGTALRPFNSIMEQGPMMKALAPQLADLRACVEELGTKESGRPNCSPAGTDFRIDWACSLGRNGERYFLLVVDKDTEYLANFNTKSPQSG